MESGFDVWSHTVLTQTSFVNALFESSAGLTTTGISMFLKPETLPNSLLFWRSFMQWIGGLGILTFFIAVLRESGGVTRRLYSAEAHKTDSGSIRPSLKKSITDLWRVYGFLTTIFIGVYIGLGMSPFNSVLHSFSAISTGGFSTISASIGGFNLPIQVVTILFMFLGGVNFVLLYRFLRADYKPLFRERRVQTLFQDISTNCYFHFSGTYYERKHSSGSSASQFIPVSSGYLFYRLRYNVDYFAFSSYPDIFDWRNVCGRVSRFYSRRAQGFPIKNNGRVTQDSYKSL